MNIGRRLLLGALAPALAFVVAAVVTSAVLIGAGDAPADFWRVLLTPPDPRHAPRVTPTRAACEQWHRRGGLGGGVTDG